MAEPAGGRAEPAGGRAELAGGRAELAGDMVVRMAGGKVVRMAGGIVAFAGRFVPLVKFVPMLSLSRFSMNSC